MGHKKMTTLWKALTEDMRSFHGNCAWKIGEWKRYRGNLSICQKGFHASPTIAQAMSYVNPGYVCLVEAKGAHQAEEDKQCWEKMRVIKAYKWTKEDSVEMAIYAAQLALPIFEKSHPNYTSHKKAIQAAKNWLRNKTDNNVRAARTAARMAADIYAATASVAISATICAALAAAADTAKDASAPAANAALIAATAAARASAAANAETKVINRIQKWCERRLEQKDKKEG